MGITRRSALVMACCLVMPALSASTTPAPPTYELKLVYIFETPPPPQFIFVIGNSGFTSVESLQKFVATLPSGTTLRWDPGCIRMGGEPLLSSATEMKRFVTFCASHGVKLVVLPGG